jgi:prepilin-type processing-associated H-X9-DG protein
MNRLGFSLTDLLASLVMLVVVALFCLAATVNLDSRQTRVKCASNLRQIGQGLLLYSNDSRGNYPRTRYDPDAADHPTVYTGVDNPDPFAAACPQVNDVSAALYLLLRTEDITSAAFICPATGNRPLGYGGGGRTALNKSNFPSGETLSYSYADPYPSVAAAGRGYNMVQGLDPTFVVAADMNPGMPDLIKLTIASTAAEMRAGNSGNHSGDGQNALYGDGHVEFNNNPFVGTNRDNIYTYGASGVNPNSQAPAPSGGTGVFGSPVGPGDSVLLPAAIVPTAATIAANTPQTALPANSPPPAAVTPVDQGMDFTPYMAIASLIFLLVLLGALAAVYMRTKRSRQTP